MSQEAAGVVVEMMGQRRGTLHRHEVTATTAPCTTSTRCPPAGLLGFRQAFLTQHTRAGHSERSFRWVWAAGGAVTTREQGSLVAWETGVTATFGLNKAQERGTLFLGPGVEVYEGQVVGQHIRERTSK